MSELESTESPVHSPPKTPQPEHQEPAVYVYQPEAEEELEEEQQVETEVDAPATPVPLSRSASSSPTRTIAIIKNHALAHRFDIEHRISEAGFEIVKERQMEFDVETDPETLFELFGDDYESFAEGPVWVYVLERRRAVEVWATLMGHADPVVAREGTPHSLRALYGLSAEQNAVMGSPDASTAEMQIAAIFVSSPPFPTTELPDVGYDSNSIPTGSLRSVSSSVLSALRKTTSSGHGSSVTSPSSSGKNKTPFKARALPATHATPDIVPRMSRAAALRAGLPVEKTKTARAPLSKERIAQTFQNVPGHKRMGTIAVASTAPPAVAPRMTRAASLRLGLTPPEKPGPRKSVVPVAKVNGSKSLDVDRGTFEGVPGHKRRETIAVASTRPPSVMPKTNKSASLRQMKDAAPPSSFMFRSPSNQPPSRSSSRTSHNAPSSFRVSLGGRPASASVEPAPARPAASRTASQTSVTRTASRPSTSAGFSGTVRKANGTTNGASASPTPATSTATTPAKPKAPRPSSMQAPTITPRTNKSALLRAAKMAQANAVVPPKGKALPVSRAVKV